MSATGAEFTGLKRRNKVRREGSVTRIKKYGRSTTYEKHIIRISSVPREDDGCPLPLPLEKHQLCQSWVKDLNNNRVF